MQPKFGPLMHQFDRRSVGNLDDVVRVGGVGLRRRRLGEVEAEVEQQRDRERRGGHRQQQREEPSPLPERY